MKRTSGIARSKGSLILVIILFFTGKVFSQVAGDYGAYASGTWSNASIWKIYNGVSWGTSGAAGAAPSSSALNIFILPASVVTLTISQTPCNNLTINSGGKLWTNSSGSNTYLYVYGNITCDGAIGTAAVPTTISGAMGASTITVGSSAGLSIGMNVTGTGIGTGASITGIAGTTITLSVPNATAVSGIGSFVLFDAISFGIEGSTCLFTGAGTVDCSRIRKNNSTIITTDLTIDININLRFSTGSTTQIYNTADGTVFNVTLNAGKTLNLTSTSGYTGNVAMDGIYGNDAANRGGSYTIKGTLILTGTLYLNTNNGAGGYPCSFTITSTGMVITPNIIANNSGSATHTFTMNSGSLLQITGAPSSQFFFTTNNIYNLNPGSTIEYSGTSNHIIDNAITYANLKLSTGAVNKTANGALNIAGDLTISSPAVLVPDAVSPVVNIGGNWTNYATAGFSEGLSTVNFNGSGTQNITVTGGEDFYYFKVNKSAGKVVLNSAPATIIRIINTLDLTLGNILTSVISGGYYVRIQNTASVINVSDNSFVEGACGRELVNGSAVNFTFPVGKNARYRPEKASGTPTVNCLLMGEYYPADPNTQGPVTTKQASLNHISRCEYWRIKQQGTATAQNFIVSLSWPTYGNCFVITNLADLRVASWASPAVGTWNDLGNSSTSGSTAAGTVTAGTALGLVSSGTGIPVTLASDSLNTNPLPMELISFEATAEKARVDLHWVTATEVQNAYFTVEKSRDDNDYEEVLRMEGAGNSTSTQNYYASDLNPYDGISYYRLKQTDIDGKHTYSMPVAVNMKNAAGKLVLFPNPAKDNLRFFLPHNFDGGGIFRIINSSGQIVLEKTINGKQNDFEEISLSDFPEGVYVATLESDFVNTQQVFLKN